MEGTISPDPEAPANHTEERKPEKGNRFVHAKNLRLVTTSSDRNAQSPNLNSPQVVIRHKDALKNKWEGAPLYLKKKLMLKKSPSSQI